MKLNNMPVLCHRVWMTTLRHVHEYGLCLVPLIESHYIILMAGVGAVILLAGAVILVVVEDKEGSASHG